MKYRLAIGMLLGCLLRCNGCLPPLLPNESAIESLPSPTGDVVATVYGVSGLTGTTTIASMACTDDNDCPVAHCCDSLCQTCCQTSDCPMTGDGVQLLCSGGDCKACSTSGPSCATGSVCCTPGVGGNGAMSAACKTGNCCTAADCDGSAAGSACINNRCALGTCSGQATACSGGLCCSGACVALAQCCSSADCSGGKVCSAGSLCVACDGANPCAGGQACCGGSCVNGGCCAGDVCPNPRQACIANTCQACTAPSDCGGEPCCADPVLGPICLQAQECCPSLTDNVACDLQSDPTLRACSTVSHSCGACDATTAPCAPGKTCCVGACLAPTGGTGACCANSDCTSNACDTTTHQCVACAGSGLCGQPTAATGVDVCESESCVACDAGHGCGAGAVCCGAACFAGDCCTSGDCPAQSPVCDPLTRLCRNCSTDSDCGAGHVCIASIGTGACPSGGTGCSCHAGNCDESNQIAPPECAGACCGFSCAAGGDCCGNSDCTAPTPGHQAGSACTSVVNAAPTMSCLGHACGCPPPSAGVLYVDVTLGSDTTGTGSPECPLRSIGKALQLGAGQTIDVRPGTYDSGIEAFPLDVPATTTVQRDPSCASGTVAIVRDDGNTSACPVQRQSGGTNVSCAIAVRAAGVALHGLNIKNTTGTALAFGSGANATTVIDSSTVGCEASAAQCDRGQLLGQNGGDDVLIAGTASPTIGPAAFGSAPLLLAPAHGSALAIVDRAQPNVRNLSGLFGMDNDVIRVQDSAQPVLSLVQINWPSGPSGSNAKTCVNVTGTGPGISMTNVFMHACGTGGIFLRRAPSGSTVPHALSNVIVDGSGGTPQTPVNNSQGFGLWADSPSGTAPVQIFGGSFTNNVGHGVAVLNAGVSFNGVLTPPTSFITGNGADPPKATTCYGGNGIAVLSNRATMVATNVVITTTGGRTTPPGSANPCTTGNGVYVAQGIGNVWLSQVTNNAFNGLYVTANGQSTAVVDSLFSGNAANGIEVVDTLSVNLGSCSGNPLTCDGAGTNYFHCPEGAGGFAGNGRANLCFVTTIVPRTLHAQINEWVASPHSEIDGDYDFIGATNAHCAGLGPADVINLSGALTTIAGFPPNQVITLPELSQRICN